MLPFDQGISSSYTIISFPQCLFLSCCAASQKLRQVSYLKAKRKHKFSTVRTLSPVFSFLELVSHH